MPDGKVYEGAAKLTDTTQMREASKDPKVHIGPLLGTPDGLSGGQKQGQL
jgi:hypothetical protein